MSISVAVDGPAGAGKSTIAKIVAKKLGYVYVDTGAMYRAMGCYFTGLGIDREDSASMSAACGGADISIAYENGEQQVFLNGENVNGKIRTEEAGLMASACAKNKDVRLKLVELQRAMAKKTDVVMDGRDIGTYVLPDADVKIYLTASVDTRAKRRYEELQGKNIACDLEDVKKDIIARDDQDMHRKFAPLRQAEDAVLIDSSDLAIEEVTEKMCRLIAEAGRQDLC